MRDELTGLNNRHGFYQEAAQLLEDYPEEQFCLIYWNIRRFKVINNLFGWQTGDRILIDLAGSLQKEFGKEKVVYGRMERDNFICCVRESAIENKRLTKLGNIICSVGESEYRFSCCYGIYRITDAAKPISSMVDKARIAMESVKDNYVSPYAVYNENMLGTILEEEKLVGEFETAIAQKQFKVYYQPICRTYDGEVVSAEALVRWQHPKRGLISPGAFIPLFEKNGFISILDRYVWNEVCLMLKKRLDRKQKTVPVSVNVSRVEFYNCNLCEEIYQIVQKNEVPAELIKIEITESAYSDNPVQVKKAVDELHGYGFEVLMDDFGSGYSSLNTLKDLPIDVLKIDMKFLDGFEQGGKAVTILESVIRMAKWMKLKTVTEGVETRKEWDYLNSIECDMVQGYFFYKPMPQEDFEQKLETAGEDSKFWKEMDYSSFSEDRVPDLLYNRDTKGNEVFFNMIGAMGILEMSGDALEIIKVNNAYYKVMGIQASPDREENHILHTPLRGNSHKVLIKACRRAKEEDCFQQVYLHHQRADASCIWLRIKVSYMGGQGRRSLFYFTLDNINDLKELEQERNICDYGAALLKLFEKVYRLDYDTGMAEVLFAKGEENMQQQEEYYFLDFFKKFADHIEIPTDRKKLESVGNKESLDRLLAESRSGGVNICYTADYENEKHKHVREQVMAAIFKLELESGKEEYICCVKKRRVD